MERSTIVDIPLNLLVLSPANVRKTPATAAEDAELEASLRGHGLKENLVVHAVGDGTFAVVAGERRRKALSRLAGANAIPADFPVPCRIESVEDALETSLVENLQRAAMSPYDQFVAMAGLIDSGHTIADVARRFGVTERRVHQQLKLGKAAPQILEAYRDGKINLDLLKTFTLGSDHAAQLLVWERLEKGQIGSWDVRRALTQEAVSLGSRVGGFVGAEAYEAAGGTVRRDLFSTDNDGFMDDTTLVQRLAIEKLEAKAEELRSSWKWVKVVPDAGYRPTAGYIQIPPEIDVPQELVAEHNRLVEKVEEIENTNWSEESEELTHEENERFLELDHLIRTGFRTWPEEARARSGCIVTIGHDGNFGIHYGLVEPDPAETSSRDGGDPGVANSSGGSAETSRTAGEQSASEEKLTRKEAGISQSHVDDLKAHRLQCTRAYLSADFGAAFDIALYTLCRDLLYRRSPSRILDLRGTEFPLRSSLNDLDDTPAARLLKVREAKLRTEWLSLPAGEDFKALSALPFADKQALFAWCIAHLLQPQLAFEDGASPVAEQLGARLAIPFAEMWRPSAENYWGRVKKGFALAVGGQILGEAWAEDHATDKKAALAKALEAAFSGGGEALALDEAVQDRARSWIPPGMEYASPDARPDPDEEIEPEDDVRSGIDYEEGGEPANEADELPTAAEALEPSTQDGNRNMMLQRMDFLSPESVPAHEPDEDIVPGVDDEEQGDTASQENELPAFLIDSAPET